MSIVSLTFLLFLGITLLVYYMVPGRMQWWVLLAASVVFYAFAGLEYLPLLAASILISYFSARSISAEMEKQKKETAGMERAERKRHKEKTKRKCRKILTFALLGVLAFFAFLKYYNFAAANLNALLSPLGAWKIPGLKLILPLGISFYTFQIIAYLTDVYRGKCRAETNLAKYALYVCFFPQITEGPIARYDQLAPQLYEQREINYDKLRSGALLMVWGFLKKFVLADRLALFVNTVYGNETKYSGPVFLLAAVFFSVEIYADFSGCMDIVTGAAEMFGIELARNFNHPYFSKTIPEFWRRWHISLSEWFRDYVFYPVASSRLSLRLNKGARKLFGNSAGRIISSSFPIMVVWMLTGLWHGAQWNYVAWGAYFGLLIILGLVFEPAGRKITALLHIDTQNVFWQIFQMLRTFFLCTIARVFFRADGLRDAFAILKKMFAASSIPGGLVSLGMDGKDFTVVAVASAILLTVSILQEYGHVDLRAGLAKRSTALRWCVSLFLVFSVIIFGVYGTTNSGTSFIYEKF